jgi:Enoyl-(Acyl carrier protein) reductase
MAEALAEAGATRGPQQPPRRHAAAAANLRDRGLKVETAVFNVTEQKVSRAVGKHGITCNAIAPGYSEMEPTGALLEDGDFVEFINSGAARRRCGQPRELAGLAVLLASDAGPCITARRSPSMAA